MEKIINDVIKLWKYKETDGNFLKEWESFQSLLYQCFKDIPYYKQTLPLLHQPVPLFASAKTHKFENLSNMNVRNLKLQPIID